MLYKEAYELIDIVLEGQNPLVPLTGKLKQRFFTDAVNMMSRQYVRNIEEEVFSGNGATTKFVFASDKASDRIYQVSFKDTSGYTDIPFAPQSLITNPDEMINPSYVVRRESSLGGQYSDIVVSSKIIRTTESHGLSVGDYVNILQVPTITTWFVYSSGLPKRMKVTEIVDSTNFKLGDNNISGLSQSGMNNAWVQNQVNLIFSKAPGAGTITVRFYANPAQSKDYNGPIDLPETLCKASVYCAVKELMALDGSIDISKQMNEVVTMYENQYAMESTSRQPQIDRLPMPLQDFM
jgi:hypothetical protein